MNGECKILFSFIRTKDYVLFEYILLLHYIPFLSFPEDLKHIPEIENGYGAMFELSCKGLHGFSAFVCPFTIDLIFNGVYVTRFSLSLWFAGGPKISRAARRR